MLCKCHWIVLYTVYVTAFSLGGGRFFWTRCRWKKPTVIFGVRFERRKVDKRANLRETRKLYSRVFCIFLPKSKSILITLSYKLTVSKLEHFLRQCINVRRLRPSVCLHSRAFGLFSGTKPRISYRIKWNLMSRVND